MQVTSAKRRVLERLKRVDGATVAELAGGLGLTDMAVRQHLAELASVGWVEKAALEKGGSGRPGRGRPAATWRLTGAADGQFEDRHTDLTLDLIAGIREALGQEGLDRVIAVRAARQIAAYRVRIGDGTVGERVAALARVRSEEGYQAESRAAENDEAFLLIEHHCPICDAAKACAGLCASELEVFRAALGDDVEVTRAKHLLAGDRRCVYRIVPT